MNSNQWYRRQRTDLALTTISGACITILTLTLTLTAHGPEILIYAAGLGATTLATLTAGQCTLYWHTRVKETNP